MSVKVKKKQFKISTLSQTLKIKKAKSSKIKGKSVNLRFKLQKHYNKSKMKTAIEEKGNLASK